MHVNCDAAHVKCLAVPEAACLVCEREGYSACSRTRVTALQSDADSNKGVLAAAAAAVAVACIIVGHNLLQTFTHIIFHHAFQ